MADSQYIRAEYDDDLSAYVSVDADWIDHTPSLFYRFELEESDTQPGVFNGVLAKRWLDEDGDADAECYVFGLYKTEEAFNANAKPLSP